MTQPGSTKVLAFHAANIDSKKIRDEMDRSLNSHLCRYPSVLRVYSRGVVAGRVTRDGTGQDWQLAGRGESWHFTQMSSVSWGIFFLHFPLLWTKISSNAAIP